MAEQTPARPKNVVVVDAENPLVEVQGEFFWREDHDAIVAVARDEAYRTGYADGWAEASRRATAPQLVLRSRPSLSKRLLRRAVVAALMFAFLGALILTFVDVLTSRG